MPKPKAKTTIGRVERIALPKLGFERVMAKMDTGAFTSALHYQEMELRMDNGRQLLAVKLRMGSKQRTILFKRFKRVVVRTSGGPAEERYAVRTTVELGGRSVRTEFTLSNRSDMRFQVLLGRKFLSGRFVVDVDARNVLG